MSKQTSLQFFLIGLIDLEIGKGIPTDKEIQLHNLYAQAKAMEREQIEMAFKEGNMPTFDGLILSSKEYYDITYKGGDK
jgi:hypothetical protein